MQRNRSPVRFRRERSPSIVTIHSRDQSRERSFSISSLSSFNSNRNIPVSPIEVNRVDNRDVNHEPRHAKRRKKNYDRSSGGSGKKRDKSSKRDKKENDIERFIPDRNANKNNSRPRQEKTSYPSSSQRHSDEEMLDPSVSLQEQASYHLLNSETELNQQNSNRLDRLEKLLETLLYKKIQQKQQQLNSGFIPENSDNPFELIPRNNAFTTSMWLNKINAECLDNNYDEKTCIQYMQSRMSGLMKAWFKTLDIYEYSWPELKMLVIRTFPDNIEFSVTLRMLVERYKKPEETITQYYFSKMYLLEACKITGANAVSCLIDGLNDSYLQQEAKVQNFLTPEILYSQFFTKLPNFGIQQPHLVPDDVPRNDYHATPVESSRSTSSTSRIPAKKCYTCKKYGHLAADCRHAPLCYKCNKEGHIAAKCPRN